MRDLSTIIENLHRPKLLVQAARFGLDFYKRDQSLRRLLHTDVGPKSGQYLLQLFELEGGLNAQRLAREADYSSFKHIGVLTALMAEANRYRSTRGLAGL